jgi:hypothetical protein
MRVKRCLVLFIHHKHDFGRLHGVPIRKREPQRKYLALGVFLINFLSRIVVDSSTYLVHTLTQHFNRKNLLPRSKKPNE